MKLHYIGENLPKPFEQERKTLFPHFQKAKRMKKKVSWKAEYGQYCLYIDNANVNYVKNNTCSSSP